MYTNISAFIIVHKFILPEMKFIFQSKTSDHQPTTIQKPVQ